MTTFKAICTGCGQPGAADRMFMTDIHKNIWHSTCYVKAQLGQRVVFRPLPAAQPERKDA